MYSGASVSENGQLVDRSKLFEDRAKVRLREITRNLADKQLNRIRVLHRNRASHRFLPQQQRPSDTDRIEDQQIEKSSWGSQTRNKNVYLVRKKLEEQRKNGNQKWFRNHEQTEDRDLEAIWAVFQIPNVSWSFWLTVQYRIGDHWANGQDDV